VSTRIHKFEHYIDALNRETGHSLSDDLEKGF
jgi:hypothetical protein